MPFSRIRRTLPLIAAAYLALTAFPSSAADCIMPGQAPVVPDGTTATVDQMKAAHSAIQDYVSLLERYQDCTEAKIKLAPKGTKAEDLQKLRDSGNAAIDQAHSLSDNYKAQVTAFKNRAPK